MNYKQDAAKAHKTKLKGYADGGGIREESSLLNALSDQFAKRLAPPEEIEEEGFEDFEPNGDVEEGEFEEVGPEPEA